MIDLRYHVYSLAAVFFALIIGMVVGHSFVVGGPVDITAVKRISKNYEHDLSNLKGELYSQRDDLKSAKADLDRSNKMCSALIPIAFRDKLAYHSVAIIQTGDYGDLASDIKTVLQSAGALVSSTTKISSTMLKDDDESLFNAMTNAGIVPKNGETDKDAIIRTIAESIAFSKHPDKLASLQDSHVVDLSGDYTGWNKYIVIVGGSSSDNENRLKSVDVPLINQLLDSGATVVGCEPYGAVSSDISAWEKTGIATVDNADRSFGQVSLICALSGETAHFGQKKTSDRLIPQMLGSTR